ncbi:MAG: hypothetical protein IH965_00870 [Gemmatimonadetes bacterium]|nr:hypothetical protein [Gemmatimonadota bacterium]
MRSHLLLAIILCMPVTRAWGQVEPATLETAGRRIGIDEERAGKLSDSDSALMDDSFAQAWVLAANGLTVTIDLVSNDFDAYLMLLGPDGLHLTDDDGAGRCNSRITHTLALEGEYRIVVNTVEAGRTGAYTLRVAGTAEPADTEPCRGGVVASEEVLEALAALPTSGHLSGSDEVNDTITATDPTIIDDGPHALVWEIDGSSDAAVTVTLESDAFDAYLLITGPGLEAPLSDDDCGGGRNAGVTFVFPEDGTYRVIVTTFRPSDTGPFALIVRPARDAATAACNEGRATVPHDITEDLEMIPTERVLAIGDEIDDELAIGDFTAPGGAWVRAYELVGTAGNTVTVDLTSDAFDALLILIGPGLAEPVFDDDGAGACNARITITFPEDGTYRILASTFAPETGGAFTLRAAARPGPVDPTACDG